VTSDLSPEVEIRPFRACAMHPAIIIGTIRSLWTWLWGRYHVPQNAFLVNIMIFTSAAIKVILRFLQVMMLLLMVLMGVATIERWERTPPPAA